MARVNLPAAQPFYNAAQRFVDVALRGDDSLFAPGQPIWSLATLNKLHHDFVEQPDTSSRSFEIKFKDQLASSDPDTILLAGELLYVHLLPANGIKPETKRGQIRRVLSWAREPITTSIPQELDKALENGVAKAAQAFLIGKPFQIAFLLEVVRQWKQLTDEQQSRALIDPWEFKRFLFGLPIHFAYGQRELLLHIVYPDTFEATMAREHKQEISASFAHLVDNDVPDVDQRLVQIRLKLEPTYGQGFSFYEDRLKGQWLENIDPTDFPDESIAQMSQSETPGLTAAQIGLSGVDQIRIALQAIINNGGMATIQDIYEAVENAMNGNSLSQMGKSSLRFFINTVAVKNGYLFPYDKSKPGWRITPQGRQFIDLSDPENITRMEQKSVNPNRIASESPDTPGIGDHANILPRTLGEKLRPYIELVTHLGASAYSASQIVDRLGQIKPAIANLTQAPNADTLAADLMRLRLLEHLDDGRYCRWEHLSDATMAHMLRYAALTLLVPAGEEYDLPALNAPLDGLPHPPAVWPLQGAILPWYQEAGLVRRNEDGTWQSLPGALDPLDAPTPTAIALNTFLDHLHRARVSPRGLPPLDDTPLQPLDQPVLDQRIAEIQRELLIDRDTILRIYRSLIAGQHVILSGPPGTGKTHLARILPRILWRDASDTVVLHMPITPELPPTTDPDDELLRREGYAVEVVTATEDWGVRHVVGGIAPQLQLRDQVKTLIYGIRHGHLTRAVLTNYQGYDSETIPALDRLKRHEPIDAQERRYHGQWLVIDEFTRAQIDAAFGSLLTTLGGQRSPTIAVPTDDGGEQQVPLPRDFRLIGTLNSFDRHFLNQMSEAMKRRFAFIDILPPGRADAEPEQALAIFRALLRLSENRLAGITADEVAGIAVMPGVLEVRRVEVISDAQTQVHYQLAVQNDEAQAALHSFWRLFSAIRLYRQLVQPRPSRSTLHYSPVAAFICRGASRSTRRSRIRLPTSCRCWRGMSSACCLQRSSMLRTRKR